MEDKKFWVREFMDLLIENCKEKKIQIKGFREVEHIFDSPDIITYHQITFLNNRNYLNLNLTCKEVTYGEFNFKLDFKKIKQTHILNIKKNNPAFIDVLNSWVMEVVDEYFTVTLLKNKKKHKITNEDIYSELKKISDKLDKLF
ncbi:MAG: hypothetical protein WCX20_03085 [Candidatus Shapirobacteria bacterium]